LTPRKSSYVPLGTVLRGDTFRGFRMTRERIEWNDCDPLVRMHSLDSAPERVFHLGCDEIQDT